MENDTSTCEVKPLGSLKPINSVLPLKLRGTNLILLGFGNELRVYSQDLSVVHDQLTYHDSHNIYGIRHGDEDDLIAILGLHRVVWCRLYIQESNQSQASANCGSIRCVRTGELNEIDLFLESSNYIRGRWLIGSSTGKVRLCQFGGENHGALRPQIQGTVSHPSPTLYCMRIFITSGSEEAMIVSGSAFSTVHVSILNIERQSITQEQVLRAHNGVVYDVRVSRDGAWIISSSDDRKIVVWAKEEGAEEAPDNHYRLQFSPRYILAGHEAIVWSVDGLWERRIIASISEDGSLFVWNLRQEGARSHCLIGESRVECINSPESKVLKAHQGRGARIVQSMDDFGVEDGCWTFITGGEGGDLKVWKYITQDRNAQLSSELAQVQFHESRVSPDEADDSWYQGVHLLDQHSLIGVTRQGELRFGTKSSQNHSAEWGMAAVQDLGDFVYSMSCLDAGHLALGSSRGKVIHGFVSPVTWKMEMCQELLLPNWTENVTFIHYFTLIDNELYLALSSCSRGLVGASIAQRAPQDSGKESSEAWRASILPIKGTPRYGELKCVDILQQGAGLDGKIVCGTVNGNVFILDFRISRKDDGVDGSEGRVSVEIGLSSVLSASHKGNVSSIAWMGGNSSCMAFQSTGQDGKINQYSVGEEARLEWSHRWISQCEYIVRSLRLRNSNNWVIIGSVKHELLFFIAKDSVTSTPIPLLRHRFGGIKRSFRIDLREYSGKDILEIVWCQKPSIRIDQLNLTDLLESRTSLKSYIARLSTVASLNSNPPSRLTYSSAWLSNNMVAIGGEDHIVRFYDVSDPSRMLLIQSIRLLDPIRRLKILSIREGVHILIAIGGRQTLHMFEVRQDVSGSEITIKTLFSNNSDKKCNNCRFISLDYLVSPILPGRTYRLLTMVGSSKGEVLVFSLQLSDLGERLNLDLKNISRFNLPFVPFSITARSASGGILAFIGLSNGAIQLLRSSKLDLSPDEFSLDLVLELEMKPHTSGVNSVILLDEQEHSSQIVVSSGHDQMISVSRVVVDERSGKIHGESVQSIPNAHFSSIRDICYDQTTRALYSISWDQILKSYRFDELTQKLTETGRLKIPIWDASCVSISTDRRKILVSGGSGSSQVFKLA
ncbi:WD repeat protein [Cryptosporidium canis]|nr:WD repeat protein [Cryptosporidium canis]